MKFDDSTADFPQSCFDVFLGSIVFTDETTQISKVLYKLKWLNVKSNRCSWCVCDTHHVFLRCTDGKPSLLCFHGKPSLLVDSCLDSSKKDSTENLAGDGQECDSSPVVTHLEVACFMELYNESFSAVT